MQGEKEFINGFIECFDELPDKRQSSKITYPLIEIIFLTIVAVAGSAGGWKLIEAFGKAQLKVLREYFPFANGIPSDDTIRRFFEICDPNSLNAILQQYFQKDLCGEHIAIDGKSVCGSRRNGIRALHMLNAYASGSGLTLYGKEVDTKANEITAIPECLECLDIKGSTVTIDAMGCQKNIASSIIEKGGNYVLGLKRNQTKLYNQVRDLFSCDAEAFFETKTAITKDTGHGRVEERTCRVVRKLDKVPQAAQWSNLNSIIEIKRNVISGDKVTESTNFYISSLNTDPEAIMKLIRSHWQIESMHWTLDVVFGEDKSAMYKGNIPANIALIRRFVLNALNGIKGKQDTRPRLMRMIGWSDDYLRKFIDLLIHRS